MTRRDADRGQSIQIGAVLLFGVLVILLATYQAVVVPDQNREIEANHADAVAQQMQQLRNAVVSMASTGSGTSVTLQLGTTYPARVVALNPPAPTGTFRTVGTDADDVAATVANGVATNDQTARYWNGTNHTYRTGGLAYQPGYNEYRDPPTITYENSMLFHRFDGGVLPRADQQLVDGRRLSLVAIDGTLDTSTSGAVSADLDAVSASTRRISITNSSDGPVEIAIPSQVEPSQWRAQFVAAGEWANQTGGHVERVTGDSLPDERFDLVRIQLSAGVTYDLQLAKVGIGTGVGETGASYVTAVGGQSVEPGESFTAEVRDRYNNPVSGVAVEPTGCGLAENVTDADGRVTYECAQQGTVELQIDDGAQDYERVTFGTGTGAAGDSQAPAVDQGGTTASGQSVENCLDPGPWGSCVEEIELSQVTLDYDVSDGQSGLDSVSLALRDDSGTVVTETAHDLGGDGQHQGTWTSPWLEIDESDFDDHDVRVRAVDQAGNEAVCVAEMDDNSCQLQGSGPGFQTLEGEVTNSRGGGTEATEVTVSYRPTATAPGVDLTVEDDLGRTFQSTGPGTTSLHDETVSLTNTGGGPTDNFPLDVTAEVDGGQCRTATIQSSGQTVTLADGDWTTC